MHGIIRKMIVLGMIVHGTMRVESAMGSVKRWLRRCAGWSRSPHFGRCGLLRRQSHVKLNSNFVFGPDTRFAGRLDAEVRLFHDGRDWMSLPA